MRYIPTEKTRAKGPTVDALTAIMTRRSIRSYDDRPVEPELVERLLRAAVAAPSAGNQQPWRFVVVTERRALDALSQTSPYAGMLARAPLAIAVCGETVGERHPGYWVEDCSAAMQNLLLAAHASGLGAVWLGYHPDAGRVERVRDVLGLPESVIVLGIASIGYPAEERPVVDRYREELVHRDRW
jgi:nitroreductase